MRKIFMMIMAISFCAAAALAGPVERELPETTPVQIKNNARQMVDQGFNAQEVIDLTRQMLANNFSEQHVLQVQTLLMNARSRGLPTEPMMSKAYEGLAKQVQADAVLNAMKRVQSRQDFATKQAGIITNDKTKIEQMAAILAESMAAGINDDDAGRIMQALQERTLNMAQTSSEELALETFMITRTWARLGMPSKFVADSVCQALQQGYTLKEMFKLRHEITAQSRYSKDHSFNEGQYGGQEGMGSHGSDSGGSTGGGSGGGMSGGRR
jgi:hypothetical protein